MCLTKTLVIVLASNPNYAQPDAIMQRISGESGVAVEDLAPEIIEAAQMPYLDLTLLSCTFNPDGSVDQVTEATPNVIYLHVDITGGDGSGARLCLNADPAQSIDISAQLRLGPAASDPAVTLPQAMPLVIEISDKATGAGIDGFAVLADTSGGISIAGYIPPDHIKAGITLAILQSGLGPVEIGGSVYDIILVGQPKVFCYRLRS